MIAQKYIFQSPCVATIFKVPLAVDYSFNLLSSAKKTHYLGLLQTLLILVSSWDLLCSDSETFLFLKLYSPGNLQRSGELSGSLFGFPSAHVFYSSIAASEPEKSHQSWEL